MKKLPIFLSLLLFIMLAACNSNKATETPTTPVNDADILGHLTVTVDVGSGLSTAEFTPNLSIQALTDETGSFNSSSFVQGAAIQNTVRGTGTSQTSHVAVRYEFTAPSGSTNKKYYLIPTETSSTISGTPFSKVFTYDNTAISSTQDLKGLAMSAYIDDATGNVRTENSYLFDDHVNPTAPKVVPVFSSPPTGVITGYAYQAKGANGNEVISGGAQASVIISSSFTGDVTVPGPTNAIPWKYSFNFLVATEPAP